MWRKTEKATGKTEKRCYLFPIMAQSKVKECLPEKRLKMLPRILGPRASWAQVWRVRPEPRVFF